MDLSSYFCTNERYNNKLFFRVILVSLNKKYKECRVECGALRALISVGDDERGEKFDSADRILYHFALKTCEEAAHADSTGDLDQSEIVQRYLTAKNLLQVKTIIHISWNVIIKFSSTFFREFVKYQTAQRINANL